MWRVVVALLCYARASLAPVGKSTWPIACPSDTTAAEVLGKADLSGKVFVISGGNGRIAGALELALAKRNATVVLGCHDLKQCAIRKASISEQSSAGNVKVVSLDLTSSLAIRSFVSDVASSHQHVDALVNNAQPPVTTGVTRDGFLTYMQVHLLGHAYLADLLLPLLRAAPPAHPLPGRVVNVAAELMGSTAIPANTTVDMLESWCIKPDPRLYKTGKYYEAAKLLLLHHAIELARREKNVVAFAVDPGFAPRSNDPAAPINQVCPTNYKGLKRCPEAPEEAAAVIAAAAAAPGIEAWSGSWLDFDARPAQQMWLYGPYELYEPNCVPRSPPPMNADLRRAWFDRMLQMMQGNSSGHTQGALIV